MRTRESSRSWRESASNCGQTVLPLSLNVKLLASAAASSLRFACWIWRVTSASNRATTRGGSMKPWYKVRHATRGLARRASTGCLGVLVYLESRSGRPRTRRLPGPSTVLERTYVTKTLVVLDDSGSPSPNGVKVETSAVFNLCTQFGGETHALTLLYHLASGRRKVTGWQAASPRCSRHRSPDVPTSRSPSSSGRSSTRSRAEAARTGRRRRTPWGEIAFQLGREDGFKARRGTREGADRAREATSSSGSSRRGSRS